MTAVEPGSFRDPSGQVFESDGRIFRTITARALADYTFVRDSGVLRRLVESGRLVASEEVDPSVLGNGARGAPIVVEHSRIPFVSYPYEWPFPALKTAALFHLDLQIDLLADGVMMSDASAYNVQFIGPHPVLIDLLSLRRYRRASTGRGCGSSANSSSTRCCCGPCWACPITSGIAAASRAYPRRS
jgi:hypothetical protein